MNYSTEEKARLLEGWKESGMSISAFVRENGLVRWTFHKWIKAARDLQQSFVEVSAQVMQPVTAAPEILIEKGGVRIHIPLGLGIGELRSVMEGLGAAL